MERLGCGWRCTRVDGVQHMSAFVIIPSVADSSGAPLGRCCPLCACSQWPVYEPTNGSFTGATYVEAEIMGYAAVRAASFGPGLSSFLPAVVHIYNHASTCFASV